MKRLIGITFFLILLTSCGVSSKNGDSTTDPNARPGEILVDLKQDAGHEDFISKMKKYKMEKKKVVSPSLNIILCTFNEKKIGLEKLIKKVKKLDEVENAQSNKNLNNRN